MKTHISKSRTTAPTARLLLWALVAASCMCGRAALALDPMGPPAAGLRGGQFRFGAEYSRGEMEVDLHRGRWTEYLDGLLWDWGDAESLTIKKMKTKKLYTNLGVGLGDNVEAFIRLGGADARFGDSIWEDGEKFDDKGEFAFGAGLKVTFYENDGLRFGALAQVSRSIFDGKLTAPHWTSADKIDMDITEAQIALGPTVRIVDGLYLYGGPFFHLISGNLDDEFSENAMGGVLTSFYSWDLDESSAFGAYIGGQLELGPNCVFNIEYQHTPSADAACAGLLWRF